MVPLEVTVRWTGTPKGRETQYRLPAHSHDERTDSRVLARVASVGMWLPACAGQARGVLRSTPPLTQSSWRVAPPARRHSLYLLRRASISRKRLNLEGPRDS